MSKRRIVILGGGPAGVGAAYRLLDRDVANVTILERNVSLGGNTASFDLSGVRVDYGSHRLHPACDPEILTDIRKLLGDDLLDRPRHGRIRMRGRWIHFPLKPLDLLLRLPPGFAAGVVMDQALRILRRLIVPQSNATEPTFATVLERGLGRTICQDFYFPYAEKIWGLPPEKLSPIQAQRRVAAGSLGKLIQKVARALPGSKSGQGGRFLYPRRGYGQICESYGDAIKKWGGEIHLGAQVTQVEPRPTGVTVSYRQDGKEFTIEADQVWSTIPITALGRAILPSPPAHVLAAADGIDFRAMILIYLVLEQERFSEFDAYYFPERSVPISRLSEPKTFSNGFGPRGVTVLCAELPCSPDDAAWAMNDEELGGIVRSSLEQVGQPIRARVLQVTTRRIRHAYPLYRIDYSEYLDQLDTWLAGVPDVLTFGRQGLFSHDNLHHALYMGYRAADCLSTNGTFDMARWREYRREFETHVVED